jgi:hypothetical protein
VDPDGWMRAVHGERYALKREKRWAGHDWGAILLCPEGAGR